MPVPGKHTTHPQTCSPPTEVLLMNKKPHLLQAGDWGSVAHETLPRHTNTSTTLHVPCHSWRPHSTL